jgi:ABC-type Fe2+-enterobactin transport system substrate-binding protein
VALQPVDEWMEQIGQAEGNQEGRQDGTQQIDRQYQRAKENRPVPPGDAAQIQFGFFLGSRQLSVLESMGASLSPN